MKNKVLMIAYYFPPMGGGGVQRMVKFVKYLPTLKWLPVVLTVQDKIYKKTNRKLDKTLLQEIPKEVQIVRTNCIDLARISKTVKANKESESMGFSIKSLINKIGGLLINPDAQMLWIPIAVKEGLSIIRKYKIKIVYSTGNPWSDHIIGAIIKRITGLPWIVDYRDPWNICPYSPHSSKIRKGIQLFLERQVIKLADKVVFATEGMQEDYSNVFGNDKFLTIRNGFDPDDFLSIEPKRFSKFTILYSGSIWPYRRPTYFIHAVSNWLEKNPHARQEIEINFLGIVDEVTESLIEKKRLSDVVNLFGFLPHKEAVGLILGADVLLLTIDTGGESIITGKIFEYLASGRPILALVPHSGLAANCLKKEGRGDYIVNPRDVAAIEDRLKSLYLKYKKGCLPDYPVDNLQSYTRKRACENLSELFNNLKH